MKIAFMWKWWSWKTTLTSLFVKYLDKKYPDNSKIIFDVDINSHLCEDLWFIQPNALGTHFNEVFNVLEPDLVEDFWIDNIPVLWTFPITQKSTLIYPDQIHAYWLQKFYSRKSNTYFFQSWNFLDNESKWHNCYHGMLNTYELLIHHIRDQKDDFIIADTTAWSDNLWTSLYMAYDLSCFIVEPTKRSIQVYKDYIKTAATKNIYVVVNKVRSQDDILFIQSHIDCNKILCHFDFYSWIYRESEGTDSSFIEEQEDRFNIIINKLTSIDKDWKTYYKTLHDLYLKEVNGWFSGLHKIDLEQLYINKNTLWE